MRGFLLTCALTLVSPGALAQNSIGGGDYEYVVLHRAVSLKGNSDIGVTRIEGAVYLTFESADPAENLDVKAELVELEYVEGRERQLARVILTGNVFVRHPYGTVTSDAGVIEILEGTAVFTGNCTLESESSGSATGDEVIFDFESGEFSIAKPKLTISLGQSNDLDPYLLGEDDGLDWAGFLETLQAQAKSSAPSPGRRLVALLPERYAGLVRNSLIENLLNSLPDILKLLNDILQNPELYEREAWEGIELGSAVNAMLTGDSVAGPKAIVWLNRSLLQAAYPSYLTPPPALETTEDEN